MIVVIGQVVANRAARGTAKAGADGRAGGAAQLVADYRATGCAEAATNRGFILVALGGGDGTARSTANTRADRCASAAADLLAEDVTQRTTYPAADGSSAISGSHGALGDQNA